MFVAIYSTYKGDWFDGLGTKVSLDGLWLIRRSDDHFPGLPSYNAFKRIP